MCHACQCCTILLCLLESVLKCIVVFLSLIIIDRDVIIQSAILEVMILGNSIVIEETYC